jgi:hypothetical protein
MEEERYFYNFDFSECNKDYSNLPTFNSKEDICEKACSIYLTNTNFFDFEYLGTAKINTTLTVNYNFESEAEEDEIEEVIMTDLISTPIEDHTKTRASTCASSEINLQDAIVQGSEVYYFTGDGIKVEKIPLEHAYLSYTTNSSKDEKNASKDSQCLDNIEKEIESTLKSQNFCSCQEEPGGTQFQIEIIESSDEEEILMDLDNLNSHTELHPRPKPNSLGFINVAQFLKNKNIIKSQKPSIPMKPKKNPKRKRATPGYSQRNTFKSILNHFIQKHNFSPKLKQAFPKSKIQKSQDYFTSLSNTKNLTRQILQKHYSACKQNRLILTISLEAMHEEIQQMENGVYNRRIADNNKDSYKRSYTNCLAELNRIEKQIQELEGYGHCLECNEEGERGSGMLGEEREVLGMKERDEGRVGVYFYDGGGYWDKEGDWMHQDCYVHHNFKVMLF